MNIGMVCYPTYGGSGVLATELGMALAEKGHLIHFITYKRPARLRAYVENVFFHEVSAFEYPLFEFTPYESALASKLVDVVKYENLDLLHVHYAVPHASAAYMAKKILLTEGKYVPVVTTLHGTDITLVGNDRSFAPVVRFSINKSDGVTAVSQNLKKRTVEQFEIEQDIKVINNFIDFERFQRVDKDHFHKALAPNDEPILVHTSNFRKVKRVRDVIDIFNLIHGEIPSKLLLIGDGPERPALEERCRELEICEDVRFLGKQEAIEEILAIADLFLMPSESESFGLAALEAMACEVPVISTDVGGIPEVNIDGKTGYLCGLGEVEQMAGKAIELLKDREKLNRFRKNALEQAQKFDIQNILPQYESYYKEVYERSVYDAVSG